MISSSDIRRIVRVNHEGHPVWGLVQDDVVLSLVETPFESASATADSLGRLDEMALLAPVVPTKVVGVGRNYVAHAAEHGADVPIEPLLFLKPPSSVLAPGAAIELPALSRQVEHEAELVLVIGRRCRNVSADRAWHHVLGVTCGNDVTARDLQRADPQWTRGKGFDTFAPIGPWISTGLCETEAANLEIACRVNGELRQTGNTSHMVFSPAEIIEYVSAVMTLEPGDIVLTGTPAGVGPLAVGDVVEVEIETVGTLTNPVERASE